MSSSRHCCFQVRAEPCVRVCENGDIKTAYGCFKVQRFIVSIFRTKKGHFNKKTKKQKYFLALHVARPYSTPPPPKTVRRTPSYGRKTFRLKTCSVRPNGMIFFCEPCRVDDVKTRRTRKNNERTDRSRMSRRA